MKLMKSNKGSIDMSKNMNILLGIIGVVVLIMALPSLLPTLINAITNLSTIEGMPFAEFFASGGIVLLILGVGIFALIVKRMGFFSK